MTMSLRALFAKQSPPWIKILSQMNLFSNHRRLLRPALPSGSARWAHNDIFLFLFFSLLLFSCGPSAPLATPQLITVYSTFAAQPWLPPLYECAGTSAALSRIDEAAAADIVLRVGEPSFLASPAYQIDEEEILIVAHRQSAVQNLTLEAARALFAGQGDSTAQVWVYSSGEDVQEVFEQIVMEGRSVDSSARIAATPQQMSDTLVNQSDAVGILPRHWKAGPTREVFSVATVPVLAITRSEPQGILHELIACLQNK
jgi:hypothetical protein